MPFLRRSTSQILEAGVSGNIDVAMQGLVSGWLRARDNPGPIDVALFLNGQFIVGAATTIPRPDVERADGGAAGFTFTWTTVGSEDGPVNVEVRAVANPRLRLTKRVSLKEWTAPVVGGLDAIDDQHQVYGWLVDLRASGEAQGYLQLDGLPLSAFSARMTRDDVRAALGREEPCGFVVQLPANSLAPTSVLELCDARSGSVVFRGRVQDLRQSRTSVEISIDAPVGELLWGEALLSRRRHDSNPEFALMRSARAAWPRATIRRCLRSSEAEESRKRTAFTDSPDAPEPLSAFQEWLCDRKYVDARSFASDTAVLGHREWQQLYTAAHRLPGVDIGALLTPRLRQHAMSPQVLSVPGLTTLQVHFHRNIVPHLDPLTEVGLAAVLTALLTDFRGVHGALSVVTEEQRAWLAQRPEVSDYFGSIPLSRYGLARRTLVPQWADFDVADDLEAASFAVDLLIDEINNGYGWSLVGEDLRRWALGLRGGSQAPLHEVVWLASRCLTTAEVAALSHDQEERAAFREWRSALEPSHPLHAGVLSPQTAFAISASVVSQADVSIVGLLRHASGVGHNADNSVIALKEEGFQVEEVPLDFRTSTVGRELSDRERFAGNVALLHVQPDYMPSVLLYGAHAMSTTRTIGFYAWELNHVPKLFLPALTSVDEIWAPSRHCAEALQSMTDVSVHVVHHAIPDRRVVTCREETRLRFRIPIDAFVVITAFDAHSLVRRKNPLSSIRAFQGAFPDDGARLVLKVRNADSLRRAARGEGPERELLRAAQCDPRVVLLEDDMRRQDLIDLIAACDCYISLHRAEGFGYGMAEAMAVGVPTVATNYSGNLDFTTEETAWLVDGKMVSIGPEEYVFWEPAMQWMEPNVEMAVEALRAIRSGGSDVERRVTAARALIENNFSLHAMAQRYAELLRS